jgi:hypothetical protein
MAMTLARITTPYAARNGLHCARRRIVELEAGVFGRIGRKRNHERGDGQRRRGRNDRSDENMPERIGNDRPENARVNDHHGAGDAGHAAAHQSEQLAARHGFEIGAHQQRRFDHADENMDGGAKAKRAADAERSPQRKGDRADDFLQNAKIEQEGGERADDQHQRQSAKGENEARVRLRLRKWRRAAAEIAENEGRAGVGGLLQRLDAGVQG